MNISLSVYHRVLPWGRTTTGTIGENGFGIKSFPGVETKIGTPKKGEIVTTKTESVTGSTRYVSLGKTQGFCPGTVRDTEGVEIYDVTIVYRCTYTLIEGTQYQSNKNRVTDPVTRTHPEPETGLRRSSFPMKKNRNETPLKPGESLSR